LSDISVIVEILCPCLCPPSTVAVECVVVVVLSVTCCANTNNNLSFEGSVFDINDSGIAIRVSNKPKMITTSKFFDSISSSKYLSYLSM
jgi:hypothetical protein